MSSFTTRPELFDPTNLILQMKKLYLTHINNLYEADDEIDEGVTVGIQLRRDGEKNDIIIFFAEGRAHQATFIVRQNGQLAIHLELEGYLASKIIMTIPCSQLVAHEGLTVQAEWLMVRIMACMGVTCSARD